MGEWDGLGPQASQYSASPSGFGALMARIRDLERAVDQLRGANILRPAGMHMDKSGLTIASQLLVTGDTRIEGTLSLPAGIIDNEALASPIVPVQFFATASSFSTPTNTWITPTTHHLVVPAGFTKGIVIANGFANLVNTLTAVNIICYAQVMVNGIGGMQSRIDDIAQYAWATMTPSLIQLFTGLATGQAIDVSVRCASSSALPANSNNAASVNGVVLWFR